MSKDNLLKEFTDQEIITALLCGKIKAEHIIHELKVNPRPKVKEFLLNIKDRNSILYVPLDENEYPETDASGRRLRSCKDGI